MTGHVHLRLGAAKVFSKGGHATNLRAIMLSIELYRCPSPEWLRERFVGEYVYKVLSDDPYIEEVKEEYNTIYPELGVGGVRSD